MEYNGIQHRECSFNEHFFEKMWNMMEYTGIWDISIGVYIHMHRIYNQLLVGLFYHQRWGIQLLC